jgi:putative MATE family efflux protein
MTKKAIKLGTGSVNKLLASQSLPAIVGMLVMSLYNLIDTAFISNGVSTDALAGVSLVFPLIMISGAIFQSLGIGSASIISRHLGADKQNAAEKTLGNFLFLVVTSSIVVTILSLIFIDPILILFGAHKESVFSYAKSYLFILLLGNVFFAFASAGNNIIRAEGNAFYAMLAMIIGAVVNLILDPIFIFGFGWGVEGAAIATVIAQTTAALYVLYYFVAGSGALPIRIDYLRFNRKITLETISIASSSFLRQASVGLMAIITNNTLIRYGGELAVAAFGLIFRIIMPAIMPLFGITQGMSPILGFNYGAKKFDRAIDVIKLALRYSTYFSIVAFVVLITFSSLIVDIFTEDQELIQTTTTSFRIVVFMLPLVGFQLVASGVFQAIGKPLPAIIISLMRQVIVLIPLLLIMPLFYGLDGVWYSFPIADLLAAIATFVVLQCELGQLEKLKLNLAKA